MQPELPLQETSRNSLDRAPAGLAGVISRQADPFHASARAAVPCARLVVPPTATQPAADRQDTSMRKLDRDPAGFGDGTTRHLPPALRSARVLDVPRVLDRLPTAMQRAGLVHDTPSRIEVPAPAAAGTEPAAAAPGSASTVAASAVPGSRRVSIERPGNGMALTFLRDMSR